ncbi:MAG: exodeoxyribonuclease V subunit gamma, partial [Actinomycetota bacterium]
MLTLHHADELEPLLSSLAGVLTPPLPDPFTPHVVAVPSAGTADAVMAALGTRLGSTGRGDGIVANVSFLFPGQFVARALGAAATDDDPWSIERLTWTVLQILEAQPSLLPWATDAGAGAGAAAGRDPWALSRRIADLFDQYASQRPALITSWALGEDTDGTFGADGHLAPLDAGHLWQARLWREVRNHIDAPSPPARLPQYLEQMRLGAIQPNLPERVS